jgi:hypothetical protein
MTKLLLVIGYLSLVTAVHAAIPVDIYQDMESGSSGNTLTSTIMNASNHGAGSWSINGGMWVSNNNSRSLPGPVIAGGVTYPGTGGTRTWMLNDNEDLNYVAVDFGSYHSQITVACYLTVGPTCLFWNQFDTILLHGNEGYAVLQMRGEDAGGPYFRAHSCTAGWVTTFSPDQITVVAGKTYWINLHFDGIEGKTYVAAFDPDTWTQVENTVVAEAVPDSTMSGRVEFGRCDSHGDNPGCPTQTYFNHILIDYTNAAFPLVPSGGPSDTTPPSDISTVNDGTGTDIDSTLSTTQLSANWTAATDNESSITNYHYAIGDTPGSTGVVGWQTLGNVTSVTRSGLTLSVGTTYYFSVKAENGVSLQSNSTNSDGQFVVGGDTGGDETDAKVYPNPYSPSKGNSMRFLIDGTGGGEIKIYTISGKLVKELVVGAGENEVNWDVLNEDGNSITTGLYIYSITDGDGNKKTGKLAITQ